MAVPSMVPVWANGGCAGRCVEYVRRLLRITLQIVKVGLTPDYRLRVWPCKRWGDAYDAYRERVPRWITTVGRSDWLCVDGLSWRWVGRHPNVHMPVGILPPDQARGWPA